MNKLILILSLLAALVLSGCDDQAPVNISKLQADLPGKPAKLFKIQRSAKHRAVQLPALIEASEETVLTFQVPGLITTMDLPESEEVEKGQVLAKLDQRDFRNALASAQAEFDQAQSEYQRAKDLIKQDAIAKSLFDQRLAQRDKARSALDSAKKRLEDTTLRAPYDAIVAKVHIEKFENVAAQQHIVTLLSTSGSKAVAQVPASLVIKSETELPVKVTLELDAAPGVIIDTEMYEASAKADPATQTFAVRYSFDAPKGLLILPGMTGTLTGEFESSVSVDDNSFEIPLSSVVGEAGETFVWILDSNSMQVSRRTVGVTPGSNGTVTITGVKQGETLVSVGGQYLYEGAKVRPYVR